MTLCALQRGVLVDHDVFTIDEPDLFMAFVASYVRMATGEWQMRFVVVEGRRPPAGGSMAVGAMGGVVFGQELPVVSVLVT